MLQVLRDSHRQLEASACRLSAIIEASSPDEKALAVARWDIGARIMQHMALEDRHLFANLAKHPQPDVRAIATEFQARFAEHIADYADHAKQWTAERVLNDWSGYRVRTRKQLTFLAERIQQVETKLFPLAGEMAIDKPQAPSMSWTREAFAIKDSVIPASKR